MEIISNTTEFNIEESTAVAIGKFDGIHVGHRRLLDEILEKKKDGLLTCVFTFDPSPAVLFGGGEAGELLTKYEKRVLFERLGIDILVEYPLNYVSAAIPPEDFVTEVLSKRLNASFVAAGDDLSFGDKGAGNAELIKKMGPDLGIDIKTIEKVEVDGIVASSTYIRELVAKGDMEKAERFLSMPYTIMGTISHGNSIGKTLGFPTINVPLDDNKILPPFGVYIAKVRVGENVYKGLTNIGRKPTVADDLKPLSETYLYDFDGDIYGKEAEIGLLKFTRPETKFGSLEELKAQLQSDIAEYK
ncbi:MAG: bifunctional riboflavin kinase/FAD synthetase [Acetatifactor sp.]|nr:bifunctional riboflavin kinase/FAD synthetase [Acetatifactor sp.]